MQGISGFDERLAAARNGDPTAWSELYHEVAPLVFGYLRAQRIADPEDIAGEVLLDVVRGLHRFSGDARNLRSWVLTIAHHRLLDARRKEQRRPVTGGPDAAFVGEASADDPERDAISTLGLGELGPALHGLTDDQRTVLLLRVIGDLPISEVARITGKRAGAVKQLQRRAAESMRRTLDLQRRARLVRPLGSVTSTDRTRRDPRAAGDASSTTRRR